MGSLADISLRGARELCQQFVNELEALPHIQVAEQSFGKVFPNDLVIDLVLDLMIRGRSFRISVAARTGTIHPKQALRIAQDLLEIDVDDYKMLIAPSLSESSRKLLREHGFGFWDTSGSLYLELPNAIYSIERPPLPQPREGREPRHIFRGSTAQVVHTLLLDPAREWKVTRLAEEAEVSAFTSQKTLDYLEKQLWVSKIGRGPHTVRHVKKPGVILDAWAEDYQMETQILRFHQLASDIKGQKDQLVSFMSDIDDLPWAVTLEHGAEAYAPLLTKLPSVLTVLIPAESTYDLRQAAQESGYREVSSGENLRILATSERSPFLGRQKFENVWVASPIQLYLDLHSWPRRGKEQAEHLRKERIKF